MSKWHNCRPYGVLDCVPFPIAACLLAAPAVGGQPGNSRAGEVAAFGGGMFGGHPGVGGSTGLAFSGEKLALTETSFSPLGRNILRELQSGG